MNCLERRDRALMVYEDAGQVKVAEQGRKPGNEKQGSKGAREKLGLQKLLL